jgi:hypothetical protein
VDGSAALSAYRQKKGEKDACGEERDCGGYVRRVPDPDDQRGVGVSQLAEAFADRQVGLGQRWPAGYRQDGQQQECACRRDRQP